MELNEKFYHNALRALHTGTTQDEFAEVYANSSKEQKGSSIWNGLFENGKQIFTQYVDIVDTNGTVDENEINLFTTILNYLKNLPTIKDEENVPSFQGHGEDPATSGAPNPIGSTSVSRYKDDPRLQNRKELVHLKPADVMTHEEIVNELKSYIPDIDVSIYKNDTDLRGELMSIRNIIVENDENSNIIDYHIGSFSQGNHGTCGPLSQIAQLSDEKLHEMIKEGEDENGKYYLVTFPMDKNNPENTQKVYEKDILNNQLPIEGFQDIISGFAEGDADVRLIEMAFTLRFGVSIIDAGTTSISMQRVFTEPEERQVTQEVAVTEEALLQAMKDGHATIGLTYWSEDDENMNFTDVVTSSSGITGKWSTTKNRKSLEELLKLKFPQIDESKYKNLSDGEFLEFIMLLEEGEDKPLDPNIVIKLDKKGQHEYLKKQSRFTYTQILEMSNGQTIMSNHAYAFKSYNPETKEIIIANPWTNSEDIIIPLEIAEKFMRITN